MESREALGWGPMASSPVAARRLAFLLLLLAAVGVVGWFLTRRDVGPDPGGKVSRASPGAGDEAPPLVGQPVLRGARDAASPPAPPTPSDAAAEPGSCRVAFDVVGPDGARLPWQRAVFYDDRDVELAHALAPPGASSGLVDAPGPGRLAVFALGYRPWVSGPLARPPSGTHHLVARPDPGLAVAGELFAQDGTTPVTDGTVIVRTLDRIHPGAAAQPIVVPGQVVSGRFRVTGLPVGPVRVDARAAQWREGLPVSVETVAGDEALRLVLGARGEIEIVLVDAVTGHAPVAGYVRIDRIDEHGVPQPWFATSKNAPVAQEEPTVLTRLFAQPGETLRFRVEAQGYAVRDEVEVSVPETGGLVLARVELQPAPESVCRVRLHVRFEGGAPPVSVLVMRYHGGGSIGHAYVVDTDTIPLELGPGTQHLSVGETQVPAEEGVDWVPVHLDLELVPGEVRDVDAVLRPGGWVFLDGEATRRPGNVRWLRGDDTREVRARPHIHGGQEGWLLGLLPPGLWTLWCGDEGMDQHTGSVEVRAGEVVHVDAESLQRVGSEARGR